MNNLLEIMRQRYSCRSYTDQPVDESQLDYLRQAMQIAPSAVNFQPWKFYVVKSDEAKNLLRQCYDRSWFATAPMYIVAVINHGQEWVRADGKRHGDIDIAIAVEHLCLAATEQGLGTCWVCNFDAAKCHELFGMPDNEEPAVIIPVGHPTSEPTPKKRKAIEEIFVEI